MANCYQCGAHIAPNQGCRRKVATGNSIGLSFGRRITPSVRAYYGPRTLCLYCAAQYDQAEKKKTKAILIILVGIVSLWLFGMWSDTQNTSRTFDYDAAEKLDLSKNDAPTIAFPAALEPISVKIENLNCYPIDFYINNELVASVPSGMARVAITRPGPLETKLCHADTSTCGNAVIINWREGMTYTIARHESCSNRNAPH